MADSDVLEVLKGLSPRERIKKLKELQEKDKKEIEEAQKLLKESEEEARLEDEVREIPIPQVKAVDIDSLFSSEEKELFKVKRGEPSKPAKEEPVKKPVPRPRKEEADLEALAGGAARLSEEEARTQADYLSSLSKQPTEELFSRVKSIYDDVKQSGYMTHDQQQELRNIHYANHRKMQAIEAGSYTNVSRETAREMVLVEKMKNWLQESYGRRQAW